MGGEVDRALSRCSLLNNTFSGSILSIRSLIHQHVDIWLQHVESGELVSSSRQQKAVDLLPVVTLTQGKQRTKVLEDGRDSGLT
ncbi:unnamed protein product [Arctogadus glacialis]